MTRFLELMRRFAPLLGIVLLLLLLPQVNFRQAWQAMQALPLQSIVLAGGAYTLNAIAKALRWHRMLHHQGLRIPWRVSLPAFMTGAFFGMLTIGRLGELMRIEAVLQYSSSRTDAFANGIADRILDAAFLVLLASSCMLVLQPETRLIGAAALVAVGAGIALFRPRTDPPANERQNALRRLLEALRRVLLGRGSVEAIAWTTLSWAAYFWAAGILAAGVGIHAPLLVIIEAIALGTASAALPISFQGLGTREAVLAAALGPYGVSMTEAFTLSLLTLLMFYFVILPIGAVGVVWRQRQTVTQRAVVAAGSH